VAEEQSQQLTDEQLESELGALSVADLLVQTMTALSLLGLRKIGEDDRDLGQAQLAIESLRALMPVLKGALHDEGVRQFEDVIAAMQLAYAKAAGS
jgi:hypothetical protein